MTNLVPTVRLDELVAIQIDRVFANKDPQLPYVGLEHIAQGEPRLLGTANGAHSLSVNSIFRKDDILFGKLRPGLRKSVRAPFDGYCSTDILVVRCLTGVMPGFAGHIFQWRRVFGAAAATAAGTKMPRTSWNDLRSFRVFMPGSTVEQSRIATVLDMADAAIAKTEAVIAKLKQVRAGLLQDLLTRGLDEHGQLRDPVAHPEQFKNSALGWIPKTWRVAGVLDLAPPERQAILTGPFGAQLGQRDFTADGVPVLRIGNVQSGYVDWSDVQHVHATKAIELRRFRIALGDLLFARQGATTGRNALADERCVGALINYHIIRVAVDRELCEPVFLHAIFNSERTLRQISREKGRGTREGINTEQIASLRFALPLVEEQRRAVALLTNHAAAEGREAACLTKLHRLKTGLMSDLLTGRVRVPESLFPTETAV
jgi:type I restriction enzyme S subunit